MSTDKTGVLLVNLGTPDSPSTPDVRKYLRQFLSDRRVLDISNLARFFLVNFIIVPFRGPKSAKAYKNLWTDKGSPLKYYGIELKGLLQHALGNDYKVALGMRYQNPSIKSALNELKGFKNLVILPLFPQYASASTGSVHEEVMNIVKEWQVIPEIKFISSYTNHPLFIKAFSSLAQKHLDENEYEHLIFSYHGLPERQIKKADQYNICAFDATCCGRLTNENYYCYRAQCYETSRLLCESLEWSIEKTSTCFQSRLGSTPWIKPFTDEVVKQLALSGVKRTLVLVPSFVADCLETTIEVGMEYKELYEVNGGEHWQMVESLNLNPIWVEALKQLVLE